MHPRLRKTARPGLLLGLTGAAVILPGTVTHLLPESSPAARGAALVYGRQCIRCHGQPGIDAPDDAVLDCAKSPADAAHAENPGSCRDLAAYFAIVRVKRTYERRASAPNPGRLMRGEQLAREYSCFQCHGELGQGGFRNARSVKGYIPGYFGDDFALLTRNGRPDSVRAWISEGVDPALLRNPIEGAVARFFLQRQAVHMPGFRTLPDSALNLLTDYVIALNRFGAMDAEDIRVYRRLTEIPAPTKVAGGVH